MSQALSASSLPALDKYELLEEIGHGGMATVYRALDKRLGREVAVKVIHRHLRENVEVATRFVAEARASAKLRHRNIVDVYDVSAEDDRERYLVVELIRGTTLRKIFQKHRDMPAEIGAAIALELCDALDHAHSSHIIHRDVKPENVLVEQPEDRQRVANQRAKPLPPCDDENAPSDPSGRAGAKPCEGDVIIKLTDFGIAKILDAQGVTSTGQVLGSPAHMAPEQIEGGEVDERTDVFALGVLLYEALVGHLPFEGKNPAQVLRRVLDGTYPTAERERATVGGRWSRILDGALAHDVADRTESPKVLGEQIRSELAALGLTDPRAEIRAYFADPAGYPEALVARIVPVLMTRGEAARKRRDIPGAASDFNRALAFLPNDPAIFKRVTSLSSSASRALLLRRVAAIGVTSIVLGGVAYGVARLFRDGPAEAVVPIAETQPPPDPTEVADVAPPPLPVEPTASSPTAEPSATAAPSGRPRVKVPLPSAMPPGAMKRASLRNVVFSVIPQGAHMSLDGREVKWFGKSFQLTPGNHPVQIWMPGSNCCKDQQNVAVVPPAKDGEETAPVNLIFKLDMLPSKVTLVGAPPGAQFTCPGLNLSGVPGVPKTTTLADALWTGTCSFTGPDLLSPRKDMVTLKAGESNAIQWPSE